MMQAAAMLIMVLGLLAVAATILSVRRDTGRLVVLTASLAVGLQVLVIVLAAFGVGAPSDDSGGADVAQGSPPASVAP